MLKILFALFFLISFAYGQTVYRVPAASKNNLIELAFNNSTNVLLNDLKIEVIQSPEWLTVKNKESYIKEIKSNESKIASFSFDMNNEAPVNEKGEIIFKVTENKKKTYLKTISLNVTPPDKFELMQNYPNPFNPVTTISFLVPKQSFINLSVYNVLGEKVETLINEENLPGFYKTEFNANNIASGVYFYTLKTNDFVQTKKMIILK